MPDFLTVGELRRAMADLSDGTPVFVIPSILTIGQRATVKARPIWAAHAGPVSVWAETEAGAEEAIRKAAITGTAITPASRVLLIDQRIEE